MKDIDPVLIDKLNEIVPKLRAELKVEINRKLQREYNDRLETRKVEIKQQIDKQLLDRIDEIHAEIRQKVDELKNKIEEVKKEAKCKFRVLTSEEEDKIIDQTAEEIVNEPQLLEEIKGKLYGKVEQRVKEVLEGELNSQLESARKEISDRIQTEREQWEQERLEYWKKECNIELEHLAEEYKDLLYKKELIQESLSAKKAERSAWQKKYNRIIDQNGEIASLRKQLEAIEGR